MALDLSGVKSVNIQFDHLFKGTAPPNNEYKIKRCS